MTRIARFAWTVLAYNVAVILWGAYVRATGSGAGCGSHWPLCNGVIIQRGATAATLIEYSHRITSGLALASVVALLAWTWRATRQGHPSRTGAVLSLFFMLSEAAVGAGLVLFQLVAGNASAARAMFMGVHLLNTFVLLACIALTAWWLSGGAAIRLHGRPGTAMLFALGCVGILVTSSSGAVAALGDTLYPNGSLGEAFRADLSPTSHVLIRLRILHPVIALFGLTAVAVAYTRTARLRGRGMRPLLQTVITSGSLQVVAGLGNVMLLAPVWLQLTHLFIADALWIAFVLLGASALAAADDAAAAGPPESRQLVS